MVKQVKNTVDRITLAFAPPVCLHHHPGKGFLFSVMFSYSSDQPPSTHPVERGRECECVGAN